MVTKFILAELHARCWRNHTWARFLVSCVLLVPRSLAVLHPEEPLGIFAKNGRLLGKRHIGTLAGFMDHLLGRHEVHFMRVVGGIGKAPCTDLLYDIGENRFISLAADENLAAG